MSNQPPIGVPQGAIRLNTDSQKLEFFAQDRWYEMATDSPILDGGVRGFFFGGYNYPSGSASDIIDNITISTQGNATDFGNLTKGRAEGCGFSNATRALATGDSVPGSDDTIDVFTMAQQGNATDFGNLLAATNNSQGMGGLANATRGIFGGGYQAGSGQVNILQFVTINSNGNAIDFGDLVGNSGQFSGVVGGSSPTRGLWYGGGPSGSANTAIQYVTIASTGNAQDFGEKIDTKSHGTTAGNSIRNLLFEGQNGGNSIEYITIATRGNTTDFGDMTLGDRYSATSNSSSTRACIGGGWNNSSPAVHNVIDYVQIMSQGNAVDFGDLSQRRFLLCKGCISTGHGGL